MTGVPSALCWVPLTPSPHPSHPSSIPAEIYLYGHPSKSVCECVYVRARFLQLCVCVCVCVCVCGLRVCGKLLVVVWVWIDDNDDEYLVVAVVAVFVVVTAVLANGASIYPASASDLLFFPPTVHKGAVNASIDAAKLIDETRLPHAFHERLCEEELEHERRGVGCSSQWADQHQPLWGPRAPSCCTMFCTCPELL